MPPLHSKGGPRRPLHFQTLEILLGRLMLYGWNQREFALRDVLRFQLAGFDRKPTSVLEKSINRRAMPPRPIKWPEKNEMASRRMKTAMRMRATVPISEPPVRVSGSHNSPASVISSTRPDYVDPDRQFYLYLSTAI